MDSRFPAPDPYNPYASPTADVRRTVEMMEFSPIPFDVGSILARTWEVYKARWGITTLVVMGCFFFNLGMSYLNNYVTPMAVAGAADKLQSGLITFGIAIAFFLIQMWLNIGQTLTLMKIARGEPASFADVLTGGGYIITTILASLIVGLAAGGLMLAIMLPITIGGAVLGLGRGGGIILSTVAIAVAIGVLILLSIRISQFLFIIIDQRTGAMSSIQKSINMTSGKVLPLIAIFLLGFLINLGGLLALVLGLFLTIPLTYLLLTMTYCAMVDQPGQGRARTGRAKLPPDPYY